MIAATIDLTCYSPPHENLLIRVISEYWSLLVWTAIFLILNLKRLRLYFSLKMVPMHKAVDERTQSINVC